MKVGFGMNEMKREVYKITSALLQYPNETLLNNIKSINDFVNTIDDPYISETLKLFIQYVETTPLYSLCERYVETFDYNGFATLHLTYNVFKDSRRRGEALVELRKIFNESGYFPLTDELPDYLPLILEFLSVASDKQITKIVSLHYKAIDYLYEHLKKNGSYYQYVLDTIRYIASNYITNKDVS